MHGLIFETRVWLLAESTRTNTNEDTLAVHRNLHKARRKWAALRRLLQTSPIKLRTFVRFYQVLVLSVLLYGSETWDLLTHSGTLLKTFHNQCVRLICGQPIRRELSADCAVSWIRPSIAPLLHATGLKPSLLTSISGKPHFAHPIPVLWFRHDVLSLRGRMSPNSLSFSELLQVARGCLCFSFLSAGINKSHRRRLSVLYNNRSIVYLLLSIVDC
jgi:hypothetical protein